MEGCRGGGDRFKVTRLMRRTSSEQHRSLGWCQGPSPVWLEKWGPQQNRVAGEGLLIFREPGTRVSPSPTLAHLPRNKKKGRSQVQLAGDGASKTSLCRCCLEHSWARKASGPAVSVEA